MCATLYLDVTATLAEIVPRDEAWPFCGRWADKHPMNTPGPLYTSGSDRSGNGPVSAPNNVLCDAAGDDIVFRQPANRLEVRQVYGAAQTACFASYGMDGDSRWSLPAIREWWASCQELAQEVERLYEVQRGLAHPQRDVSFYVGLLRWRDYYRHEMHPHLRAYAFFLEMGHFPRERDSLPDL